MTIVTKTSTALRQLRSGHKKDAHGHQAGARQFSNKKREDKRHSHMVKRRWTRGAPELKAWMRLLLGLPCWVGNRRFDAVSEAVRHYTGKDKSSCLLRNLHAGYATWRGMPISWAEEAHDKLALWEARRARMPAKKGKPVEIDGTPFPSGAAAARFHKAGRAATRKLGECIAKGGGTWRGLSVVLL